MSICQLRRQFLEAVALMVLGFGVLCISGVGRCEAMGVAQASAQQTAVQQGKTESALHRNLSKGWSLTVRFLTWGRHLFTPLGTVLTLFGLLVMVYVVRELFRDVLIFEPLTVPARFEAAGLTSRVMANRIGYALDELETSIKSIVIQKDVLGYLHSEATPEIEIPGTRIGLKTIVEIFRSLLRVHPKHISGDIVFPVSPAAAPSGWRPTGEPMTVTVYLTRGRSEIKRISDVITGGDLGVLVQRAAKIALELANPYLYAALLINQKENLRAIEVARTLTESPPEGMFRRKAHRNLRKAGYYLWGLVLLAEKEHGEAAMKFERAVEFDPKFVVAYHGWGNALLELEKYVPAAEKFRRAIERDSSYSGTCSHWRRMLHGSKGCEEALLARQRSIKNGLDFPSVYIGWGNSFYGLDKYADAAAKYQRAIDIDSACVNAHYNLGNSFFVLKKYEEAGVEYQKVTELEPSYFDAFENWGDALRGLKKYEEAAAKYEKVTEINPNYDKAYEKWGYVLQSMGKPVEAQEKLAKAKELREGQ